MNDPSGLTNREIAAFAWALAAVLALLMRKEIRSAIEGLVVASMTPKLLIPAVLLGGWVSIAVWEANRIGAWDQSLLKDTFIWAGSGLALFAKFIRVGEPGFVRRTILATVAVPELIGFVVGIVAFSLWLELVLFPVFVILVALSTYAAFDPKNREVRRFTDGTLAIIWLLVLAGTGIQIIGSINEIDWHHQLLAAYLPLWLTLWSLPFALAMGVYSHYENAFVRVDLGTDDERARRRAKTALILGFGLRLNRLDAFVLGIALRDMIEATSFAEARDVVRGARQLRQ